MYITVAFLRRTLRRRSREKTTFGDTEIFNAQLVAALPDGCSSLHQEGVEFFPQSIEAKFEKI